MTLTVGSLFSGIGGLDLGLERAGMEVIWQSEIDPYGCRVLKKHWPEVVNHGNIKEIKWGDVVRPDIICGGYPCQPFSTAGKRNGADDPRHLWPWVREAISELRPKYAILENVRGHITLGLSTVIGELASIGYDAEWQIISANSVGAPHLRERIIILAYPNSGRQQERQSEAKPNVEFSRSSESSPNTIRELANTSSIGCLHRQPQIFTAERWLNALSLIGSGCTNVANATQQHSNGEPNHSGDSKRPETLSQSRDSGWPQATSNWQTEPDVGRVANGVPSRVDRLRGLGNAVVPQVAELIGRMVIDYDTN
jgi:DNA (cytosine-5)-methyltransferase 1